MKYLRCIALCFYLGSLFPAAQFSAAQNWVDLPQTNTVHALSQLSPVSAAIKHLTDAQSDPDPHVLYRYSSTESFSSFTAQYSVVEHTGSKTSADFLARAPPAMLG